MGGSTWEGIIGGARRDRDDRIAARNDRATILAAATIAATLPWSMT
jgi:hypothetical protein